MHVPSGQPILPRAGDPARIGESPTGSTREPPSQTSNLTPTSPPNSGAPNRPSYYIRATKFLRGTARHENSPSADQAPQHVTAPRGHQDTSPLAERQSDCGVPLGSFFALSRGPRLWANGAGAGSSGSSGGRPWPTLLTRNHSTKSRPSDEAKSLTVRHPCRTPRTPPIIDRSPAQHPCKRIRRMADKRRRLQQFAVPEEVKSSIPVAPHHARPNP